MIRQASVTQVRNEELQRQNSRIVVCMCFYPRGLKKELLDDYQSQLAPDRQLFKEWKEAEKKNGHNAAFVQTDYEKRFHLTRTAMTYLKVYAEESVTQDIYFVCQCSVGDRCHREILMLLCREKFNAKIGQIFNDYPIIAARIAEFVTL